MSTLPKALTDMLEPVVQLERLARCHDCTKVVLVG